MPVANEAQLVAPHLYYWSAYAPEVKCDLACVAYVRAAHFCLIDPIPLTETAWQETFGPAFPTAILLTNANHVRAAEFYRKKFGPPVWASALTAQEITEEIKIDHIFQHGETVEGLRALLIPGATHGETAFLSTEGYLLLGDAVIHWGSAGFSLLPARYCVDAKQNRASLQELLDYEFSVVTFAHGLPFRTAAKERFRALFE